MATEEKQKEMTLGEFIKDIMKEIEEHPDWADMELSFATIDRDDLLYLSVYDRDGAIRIDVGTEEDDEENNAMATSRLHSGF